MNVLVTSGLRERPVPSDRRRCMIESERARVVLDRLHAAADAQRSDPLRPPEPSDPAERKRYLSERYVALERDKAEYCYLLCRSIGARHVVEAGTSFGVSTIYLAKAVRENGGGTVLATEYEPSKATIARGHFVEAGVADLIDLREGDLRETLRVIDDPVDLMLIDI